MIPTHTYSTEYVVYEQAYKKHANDYLNTGNMESLKLMCQALYHYSFHVIPDQVRGTVYTPAAVAFQVSTEHALIINNSLTQLGKVSVLDTIKAYHLVTVRSFVLLSDANKLLDWDLELVAEVLRKHYIEENK